MRASAELVPRDTPEAATGSSEQAASREGVARLVAVVTVVALVVLAVALATHGLAADPMAGT
jgi:hypothetical protein